MIKKYIEFIRENVNSDIDPYGEENWSDDIEIGDKVICIDDRDKDTGGTIGRLKAGKKYEVIGKEYDRYTEYTFVKLHGDTWWDIKRFKTIK